MRCDFRVPCENNELRIEERGNCFINLMRYVELKILTISNFVKLKTYYSLVGAYHQFLRIFWPHQNQETIIKTKWFLNVSHMTTAFFPWKGIFILVIIESLNLNFSDILNLKCFSDSLWLSQLIRLFFSLIKKRVYQRNSVKHWYPFGKCSSCFCKP